MSKYITSINFLRSVPAIKTVPPAPGFKMTSPPTPACQQQRKHNSLLDSSYSFMYWHQGVRKCTQYFYTHPVNSKFTIYDTNLKIQVSARFGRYIHVWVIDLEKAANKLNHALRQIPCIFLLANIDDMIMAIFRYFTALDSKIKLIY